MSDSLPLPHDLFLLCLPREPGAARPRRDARFEIALAAAFVGDHLMGGPASGLLPPTARHAMRQADEGRSVEETGFSLLRARLGPLVAEDLCRRRVLESRPDVVLPFLIRKEYALVAPEVRARIEDDLRAAVRSTTGSAWRQQALALLVDAADAWDFLPPTDQPAALRRAMELRRASGQETGDPQTRALDAVARITRHVSRLRAP